MQTPLVSVIIPAYNCADTLGEAVSSALSQQVPLEILVIDDCSPQDLAPALAPFAGDSRVKVLRNGRNLGAAQSRNRGVSLARGAYIAYLDSDDCWREGKLQKQLALLEKTGAVLCCTAREQMRFDGTDTGRILPVKERITHRDLLRHNSIACSSVVLRREAALAFPMGHEDAHEDYILWMQVLGRYGPAVGINEPLLRYRRNPAGKSGSKWHSAKMTWRSYGYLGFGPVKRTVCFVSYALNGLWKHFLAK